MITMLRRSQETLGVHWVGKYPIHSRAHRLFCEKATFKRLGSEQKPYSLT